MKKILFFTVGLLTAHMAMAQQDAPRRDDDPTKSWSPVQTEWYKPVPPTVIPAKKPGQPPSDAIILFDGKDMSQWVSSKDGKSPAPWKVVDGTFVIVPGSGSIRTKQSFGSCQLHVEWKSPKPGKWTGQMKGNSGIYLQNYYEVQVLDGDNNPTYVNGMVGSLYKQYAPEVAPYTKNGEWQVYDIYWRAPEFGAGGKLVKPAYLTVVLNGVMVQNNVEVKGGTQYVGLPSYERAPHGLMPLGLQDHGTEVEYRNIWIRDISQ